jgi:tripartite-type tricarboxylate transporter receptor subunit TctC
LTIQQKTKGGEAMKRKLMTVVGLAISLSLITEVAWAAYPERPVTWVVTWPAGGRTDTVSRIFAPALEKILGQPVVVVNKPGAGGVVGAKEVAMAQPDGYTISLMSISMILTQYTVPTPTNLKDYIPVAQLLSSPGLVTVHSKAPWNSVRELVAYAKANPGKVKNGASGTGTSDHLFAAAFQKTAGIKFTHVPYAGDAPAVAALAGQHVDSNFAPMVAVKAFVDAGDLKVLGVASDQKRPLYPKVPTWKEQGVNMSISTFEGIYVPKGMPADIVSILEKALEKVVKNPEVIGKIEKIGVELDFKGHQEFVNHVADADKVLRELVEELELRKAPK